MKVFSCVVILIALTAQQALSQAMVVSKKDSTILTVPLSDIQYITFTSDDTVGCSESPYYGGKIYQTVKIGNQCWFRENLDYGVMIDSVQNALDNGTIEKYCYNNDTVNCTLYGGLYQWNEAMGYSTTAGVQGICPSGWHIPTKKEFDTLSSVVGNDGNALKELGQGSGGGMGTNTSGFSALLAGYRSFSGPFAFMGDYASFWTSTEYDATSSSNLYLNATTNLMDPNLINKVIGFSIRCLKD